MSNAKDIKRRIKWIKNTAKITKAMELISTVKMKKAQNLALEKKAYIKWMLEVFSNLESSLKESDFFSGNKSEKTLWVLISSNKWLCWAYNINVMKKVNSYLKETAEDMDFVTLGKRWSQFIARTWNNLLADFSAEFTDNIEYQFSKSISRFIISKFKEWTYSKVVIFYNHYVNTIKQVPSSMQYLSISKESISDYFKTILWADYLEEASQKKSLNYTIEPNETDLIEEVIPMILDSMFYDILLEAKASEHSSRMIAMKNAKDNANKYAWSLLLKYNKARQAAITKEVSEIVSWVESMRED